MRDAPAALMRLLELECESFRCLKGIRFQPGAGFNVIRGLNAQGKTSVLEAIHYLATSRSHRTNNESELACHGAAGFDLRARVARRDREYEIEARWRRGAKRIRINGVAQTRVSDLLGKLVAVFFAPEDISLVKGGAHLRRRFMDMSLSQLLPGYLRALQEYRNVLRQRNALLKEPRAEAAQFGAWEEQLAKHGHTLMEERERFTAELNRYTGAAYARLADGESLALEYKPDVKLEESLKRVFEATRERDRRTGQTNRGPHRDDFEFRVTGESARAFASQGQQKSASLALKFAELELITARMGEAPILMLDDALSELDRERAARIRAAVPAGVQCLLTTTELDPGRDGFGPECANFYMQGGRLEP